MHVASDETTNPGVVIQGNGVYDGIGVLGVSSHNNTIKGNVVSGTAGLGEPSPVGIGIAINPFVSETLPREQSLTANKVLDNVVRDNDNSGISNISNVNGVISGNLVENNGRAANANPANGIGVQNLELANRTTNVLVENNTVVGNGTDSRGRGIDVTSWGNRLAGNRVESSTAEGIRVAGSENLVEHNEVHGNGASRILVEEDLFAV